MPLVFGKSLYLHTLFFTVISLKTYRIDMSKILIIDDEVQIRTLLTRMMELEGYDVCQAGDCRAALKQLELQNPDVVLCDVFLPDGNGVDLVLAIKKAAPNVEVILLTRARQYSRWGAGPSRTVLSTISPRETIITRLFL